MRSAKFPNKEIFESSLESNFLGNINIISSSDKSIATDRSFYKIDSNNLNIDKNGYKLYNLNIIMKTN